MVIVEWSSELETRFVGWTVGSVGGQTTTRLSPAVVPSRVVIRCKYLETKRNDSSDETVDLLWGIAAGDSLVYSICSERYYIMDRVQSRVAYLQHADYDVIRGRGWRGENSNTSLRRLKRKRERERERESRERRQPTFESLSPIDILVLFILCFY